MCVYVCVRIYLQVIIHLYNIIYTSFPNQTKSNNAAAAAAAAAAICVCLSMAPRATQI